MEHEAISPELERIATEIVDACYKVHSKLGPGLLESAYEVVLTYELRKRGLKVEIQVEVPVIYDDVKIDCGYRIDLLVEHAIVIEIKAAKDDHDIFKAQLLTYLKLANKRLGFLVNFHKKLIKDGITRMVL